MAKVRRKHPSMIEGKKENSQSRSAVGRSVICGGPPGTAQSRGVPFAYPLGQVCWICEAAGNWGTVWSAACRVVQLVE